MLGSKKADKVIIAVVIAALLFTTVFMLKPEWLGLEAAAADPEYLAKLFPEDEVVTISIEADEEEWQEMLDNAAAEEYIACDITINGETYEQVGIRPKGNSSLTTVAQTDSDRYSFKIKMDEYVNDQSYYGLTKFVINNMQGDATYMKEYLSYDMFESMGISTPAYAFADISVNGSAWGLYLAVEAVEEEWAQRTYGNDYGQLYKPETQDMGDGGFGAGGGRSQEPNGETEDGQSPPQRDQGASGSAMEFPEGMTPQGNAFDGGRELPEGMTPPDITSGGGFGTGGGRSQEPNGETEDGQSPPQRDQGASGGAMELPEGMTPQGNSFSGDMGGGSGASLKYTDDEETSYSQIFDQAVFSDNSEADRERVIKAIKALNSGDKEEIEKYIDVDEVLRYFAVNTALVNTDSYICSFTHNYYLYEEDGKLSVIPWDLNLSFAGFQISDSTEAVNFPIDTPVMDGISLEDRPLIGALLEIEEYKELYHTYLNQIVEEYFESGYFEEQIERLDALIGEYVQNDATAFYSYGQYEKAVETLKEFGALRAQSISGQLDGTVPSERAAQNESPTSLIDASGIRLSDMGDMGRT